MSSNFYPCTTWSVLSLTGNDAAPFLHNLSTNDMKGLEAGTCCESLFTDVKGKVLHHAVVCRTATDAFSVVVTSPAAEKLAEHLDRYHIREDLKMEVVASMPILWFDSQEKTGGFSIPVLYAQLTLNESPPSKEPLTEATFQERRILARFPLDGQDVDQRNLPQELDRNADLISFTKGCYLGQETVARIDALGKVNQLLTTLSFKDSDATRPPTSDLTLTYEEKTIGRVTSSAWSEEKQQWLALAYVRREHCEKHQPVDSPLGSADLLS